jgi:F-type H+-transporting ATPase subunit a
MFMLAGVLTLLFFWSYARNAGKSRVPSRWGNFVESVLLFIRDQMTRPFMGEHGDRYVPLLSCFFVYILFANLLGLVPFFDYLGHGGNTATGNIFITAGLALCALTTHHWLGIRSRGALSRTSRTLSPRAADHVHHRPRRADRPRQTLRLAVRLFANMLAGHTMIAAILGFTPSSRRVSFRAISLLLRGDHRPHVP